MPEKLIYSIDIAVALLLQKNSSSMAQQMRCQSYPGFLFKL
jgi:hypothetical protein